MTSEQLKFLRNKIPFRPFTIFMPNGRFFFVPHRDYISILENNRIATVWNREGNVHHFVDIMLITELEMAPEPLIAKPAPLPPHENN